MIASFHSAVQRIRAGGLGRNAVFSMAQSIVSLVAIFFSYRIVIAHEGIASLGLWSLLMLFGGVASSFDVSGASALARSVARHDQDFVDHARAAVIHTVLLTSVAINALFVAVFLALAGTLISHMIAPEQLREAWHLLPWVAVLMLTTPLAIGISASVDGHMRADIRSVLVSAAAVSGLIIAIFAIPRWGLSGFALAQVVQQAVVIFGGWFVLRRYVPGLGWLPTQWRRAIFRSTTGYALRLNVIGALSLLLEPLTKYCINLSGGTEAVGIYELAARLAVQIRSLVISATTPLIPAFATAKALNDPYFESLLHRAQHYSNIAALAVALTTLLAAPFMCIVMLDRVSDEVLRFNALLALGWSINLFSLPLYLAAQGQGILRWNMLSHATIGAFIILATTFLMPQLGSEGVIVGVAAGLIAGTVVASAGNAKTLAAGLATARELPAMLLLALIICAACGAVWLGAGQIADTFNMWLPL